MDYYLIRAALESSFLASKGSVKAEFERILEELNRYKIEKKSVYQVVFGGGCRNEGHVYMLPRYGEKSSYCQNREEIFVKSSAKLLASARWKGVKSTHRENRFIEPFLLMKLGLGFPSIKLTVPYCCEKVSNFG